MVTLTLHPLYAELSFPISAGILDNGNPPTLSASLLSIPKYPSAPPLYRASHGPALFLLSLAVTLISPPKIAKPSAGCDTWPTNCYYYMWWFRLGKEIHPQVLVALYYPGWRTNFTQNMVAGSPSGSVFPLPAGTSLTRIGNC